ncbi:MAG: 1-(5-phosphoribosyl)-5-[(5-phosphoribosylamino)methylideneamino]imidazole-4-carboxamide isomerase [Acidimicrobiales bacterium]
MQLYAAIDIIEGQTVRLTRGDYGTVQRYPEAPVAAALRFAEGGAGWLHVIDLDGARAGKPVNLEVIAELAAASPVPVQAGGGLRDAGSVADLLAAGVARAVLGTAAVGSGRFLEEIVAEHPGKVAVALDLLEGGELAVRGWTEGSGRSWRQVLEHLPAGVAAVVVTDISRDGTFTGPELEGLASVLDASAPEALGGRELEVVSSGGVASVTDLERLAGLVSPIRSRRLAGAVVGKALHDGRFELAEAVAACGTCA